MTSAESFHLHYSKKIVNLGCDNEVTLNIKIIQNYLKLPKSLIFIENLFILTYRRKRYQIKYFRFKMKEFQKFDFL